MNDTDTPIEYNHPNEYVITPFIALAIHILQSLNVVVLFLNAISSCPFKIDKHKLRLQLNECLNSFTYS